MSGLFGALGLGARALVAHQGAIRVAGHNVSNANVEGYSRQRAVLQPSQAEDLVVGIIGRGVDLASIQRLTDDFIDRSIRQGASNLKSLDVQRTALNQAEGVYQELSDGDLSTQLTRFFQSLDDLAARPEDMAVRRSVVEQGRSLAESFQTVRSGLTDIRKNLNNTVSVSVGTINSLTADIARLNKQIVETEYANASGSRNANDLRDLRDQDLKKLSEIVQIKAYEQTDGQMNVYADGDPLVMQDRASVLTTTTSVSDGIQIVTPIFSSNNGPLVLRGGSLEGLATARDTTIPKYITDLDTLAGAVIQEFNKLHSEGIGLTGFSSLTSVNQVTSTSADLDAAGLDFTPVNGSFTLQVTNRVTGQTVSTNIQIDLDGIGSDTSLDDLQAALDAVGNISASVTGADKLSITADSADYTFGFTNDTSNVLACLGLNTFFTGKDAQDIGVNSLVDDDLSKLAAATTVGAAGDNTNALAMADLRNVAVLSSNTSTLEQFYQGSVGTLAVETAQKRDAFTSQKLRNEQMDNQRQEISGVNIDEEMVHMMEYQRAFQGAARFISVVDEMLDTLVNRLF